MLTFKDLRKRVSLEAANKQSVLFARLQGKSFWIWDKAEHKQEDAKTNGDCCFNHIIGLLVFANAIITTSIILNPLYAALQYDSPNHYKA